MTITRDTYPPDEFTDDERAAIVGRYHPAHEPQRDPPGHGKAGREQAAPYGTIYVRHEEKERAASIRVAVAQFEAVGEEIPEHLQALFDALPAELQEEEEAEEEVEEAEEEEAEEAEAEAEEEEVDLEGWTVAELRDALETAGVEIPAGARKADLIALLKEAEAEE